MGLSRLRITASDRVQADHANVVIDPEFGTNSIKIEDRFFASSGRRHRVQRHIWQRCWGCRSESLSKVRLFSKETHQRHMRLTAVVPAFY